VEGTTTFFSADAQEVSKEVPDAAIANEAVPKTELDINLLLSIKFIL
jgi:hypothetical protein